VTTFPQNNLPKDAQPWAREVTKYLSSLIQSSKADQINNSARDNQLNSSLIALTGVVSGLKTVQGQITSALTDIGILESTVLVAGEPDKINGANIKVGTLSASSITTGTLNASLVNVTNISADNITAGGTITGVTLQTASSGTRVRISGTTATFFDSTNERTGTITVTGAGNGSVLQINGPFTSRSISFSSINTVIQGGGGTSITLSDAPAIQLSGGPTFISGSLNASSSVFFTGLSTTTNAANMRVATVGARQVFEVTSSSKKFKNTITPIFDVEDVFHKKLLEIPVVAFKYNEDYLNQEDPRFNKMIPGFIAEDLYKKYPIGAELENGKPIDWNPRYIIPGMLALIQELYVKIETLEKGA
jgi:hypothetical protein